MISKEMCDDPEHFASELPDIKFDDFPPKEDTREQDQVLREVLGWIPWNRPA